MFQLVTDSYKGPLDVLLELIQKNKLDISQISLTKITQEFIAYVNSLKESDNDLVSDFVYIAGRLIRIKSNYMLNLPYEEDEVDLEQMLKEYAKYKEITANLFELYDSDYPYYERLPQEIYYRDEIDFSKVTLENLMTCAKIMRPVKALEKPRFIRVQKSLPDKIKYISKYVQKKLKCHFDDIVVEKTCDEKVVSMLGVLALVKQDELKIEQQSNFETITLEKRKTW